jgi:hypothetical protein
MLQKAPTSGNTPAASQATRYAWLDGKLETALGIIRDAREGYSAADPYVKRLWNRALMERIEIRTGQIARIELRERSARPSLVGRFK